MNNEFEKIGILITGGVNTFNNPVFKLSEEKPPLDNIPPANENFVGREEYLNSLLEDYQNGARCFVLHGIGGVGKTELAKRFVEKIADNFKAKIFVDMFGMSENPFSAEKAMFNVVKQFVPDISADIPYQQLKAVFVQFVQQQPTLILLDNAENKSAVEDLKQARAHLIVTSRETFTLTDKNGSRHIGLMTTDEARMLLYEIVGAERFTDGEADELAQLTGYLPMALRPPAALLAEDEIETAANLIVTYRDKQKLLEALVPDYYNRTIAASFELSYEKLLPEMQSRWRRLSVFPMDFDEQAIAAILNISAEEAAETQKQFRRLSLLEGNVETHRFSLHDLIREYIHNKLDDEESVQTEFLFAIYYASILLRADTIQKNREENYHVKALKLIDTEWDNIIKGQKWTAEFFEHHDLIAEVCAKYSRRSRNFIALRIYGGTEIEWMEVGLKAARKIKNRKDEAIILGNLATAYDRVSDYRKAIDYYEQSLIILDEVSDDLGKGTVLGNLGLVYYSLAEYHKAIIYHGQSLEISQEFNDKEGESNSLSNLGLIYFSLGEYQKAINYHERSLSIFQENNDRLSESAVLNNLGLVFNRLGNYSKAENYYKQVLAISHLINDELGRATCLLNLGNTSVNLAEYRKGINYYKEALEVFQKIGNRFDESSCINGLGLTHYKLGNYRKAIDYYEQSLIITQEIGHRLGEGACLGNLGLAYDSLGEHLKAIDYHKQSLIFSREIGNQSGESVALNNLGRSYYNLSEYRKAVEYLEQSLMISQKIGDKQCEGNVLINLGVIYIQLDKPQKAIEYFEKALFISQKIGDRLVEGISLGNLGIAHANLESNEKACILLKEAVVILEAIEAPEAKIFQQLTIDNCP